jgi:hypothetical protein
MLIKAIARILWMISTMQKTPGDEPLSISRFALTNPFMARQKIAELPGST